VFHAGAAALAQRRATFASVPGMPRGRARLALATFVIVAAATGCVSRLDMANAYDAGRAATTIPYAGVRGARQFPDYESIGRSILTGVDPAAAAKPGPKTGKKGGPR
jgi:hypothetical protein